MAKQKSEFGSGLVINLVKFSEHFFNDQAMNISIIHIFRDKLDNEAELRKYDKSVLEAVKFYKCFERGSYEENLSAMIILWANGATDHLYEIQTIGDKKIDKLIRKLQKDGLEMGHGFLKNKIYTFDDMDKLRQLTNNISILLDKKVLKLKNVDWGEF